MKPATRSVAFYAWSSGRCSVAAVLLLVLFTGCLGQASAVQQVGPPAPTSVANTGRTIDGISCDNGEHADYHIHAHLLMLDRGRYTLIPAGVGFGSNGCIYWLHTHDIDGIIHVEAPATFAPQLGYFFDIWGQPLSRARVAGLPVEHGTSMRVYVNRRVFTGDPRTIVLRDHQEIAIEIGPPFVLPPHVDWSGY
ncbi:MAG TPA: hypothetical protein VF898_04925 [Chloroflexota bacterium]